ncbi:MAG: hypothetical protein C0397_02535 [Odoribacter sp.]|nr:hypothetical protein [Odoribacter sp.]
MNTSTAKTIEMKPENLAEIKDVEQKIINQTRMLCTGDDLFIKDLSDSITTLLNDRLEDSLENNAIKANSLACTISFICEQRNNIKNLDFYKNQSHE